MQGKDRMIHWKLVFNFIVINFFIFDNHNCFLSKGIFNEAETTDYPDMQLSMQSSSQKMEASIAGRVDQKRSGMIQNRYGDIYIIRVRMLS